MLALSDTEGALPLRHTGKWNGYYFYKGLLWLGPTNLIGARKLRGRFGFEEYLRRWPPRREHDTEPPDAPITERSPTRPRRTGKTKREKAKQVNV